MNGSYLTLKEQIRLTKKLIIVVNRIEIRRGVLGCKRVGYNIRWLKLRAFTKEHKINGKKLTIEPVHLHWKKT